LGLFSESPERAKAIAWGNALCKKQTTSILSPERAQAHALTGLSI